MEFLSVISKGTIKDKLMWTFTFYDVDHDGVISRDEMLKVIMKKSLIQKNHIIWEDEIVNTLWASYISVVA